MVRSATTIGWREWVGLPALDTPWIKAKIDTGARSSSLHAFDLERFERDGAPWVRFSVHPWQRSDLDAHSVEVPVVDWRSVRSSSGQTDRRPVIRTGLRIGDSVHDVEVTLARRDEMGFRMLVGREALRRRFLVDPGRSYLSGRPDGNVIAANRRRVTGDRG